MLTLNRVGGGDFSPRLPHHRTCGSASGGSWQSLRTKQHSFSATVIAAQCSACRCQRSGTRPPMAEPACLVQHHPPELRIADSSVLWLGQTTIGHARVTKTVHQASCSPASAKD